jgi:putative flippase GtrA
MFKKIIRYFLDFVYPLFKKLLPYQLYAYLAVGAANTVLNIVLFAVLYHFVLPQPGIRVSNYTVASYTISLLLAFVVTVPVGYWLSKTFAFGQQGVAPKQNARQFVKYFLVVMQGLVLDYLLLKLLVLYASMHPTVAKIISTVIVLVLNYLLQKYFTFRVKQKGSGIDAA